MNPLIALDQLINTLVWSRHEGFGKPDETLSARAFRLATKSPYTWGVLRRAANTVFFWQDDHCLEAFIKEEQRRHLPKAYRSTTQQK